MKAFAYRKSPWRWVCFALIVLCLIILLQGGLRRLLALALFTGAESASIGIIGGADGPTAIFITRPRGHFLYQYGIPALLLLAAVIGFVALSRIGRK